MTSEGRQLRTPLPQALTALVGRGHELAVLTGWLSRADIRLVTLTGPGGMGKTRLAQEVARRLTDDFSEGAVWVDLAPLQDPDRVWPTVAGALGVELGADPSPAALGEALRGQGLLLILDNFEHLGRAASGLPVLLGDAPGVRLLITSRHPLRVRGEREYHLEPLSLPTEEVNPEALSESDAVRLFLERAQAVRPDLALDALSAPWLARIVRRLSGWPLALELAAARLRLFSLAELDRRLERPLDLLAGGPVDAAPHQRTLRATLAWSESLLGPGDQGVFSRLAVFQGSWTLEAAQAVCGAELDPLSRLVDEGLLRALHGEGRFTLLEPVREYALEQLKASGAESEARDAHARYFFGLLAEASPHLRGGQQQQWLSRLQVELDNVRAALSWLLDTRPSALLDSALRASEAVMRLFWLSGHTREAVGWFQRWLAGEPSDPQTPEAKQVRATLLNRQGKLAMVLTDWSGAQAVLEEAMTLARPAGDPAPLSSILSSLAPTYLYTGQLERAEALIQEGLAIDRAQNDRSGIAFFLGLLAELAYAQGKLALALTHFQEARGLYRRMDDLVSVCINLANTATVSEAAGDVQQATVLLTESYELAQRLKLHHVQPLVTGNLASAAYRLGDLTRASQLNTEALHLTLAQGNLVHTVTGLMRAAMIAAKWQRPEAAMQLCAAAQRQLHEVGQPWNPAQQAEIEALLSGLGQVLSPAVLASARTQGELLSLERAVDLAVRTMAGEPPTPHPEPAPAALTTPDAGLTRREREVLRHLARGLSDKRIASELGMSPRTVNSHLTSIFSKLGVQSRTAAARHALDQGLG